MQPFIRQSADEHRTCTAASCAIYTVSNTDEYKLRHVEPACECEYIRPQSGEVESVLRSGDIPVVVYDGEDLMVLPAVATELPYVAISHVWADGLGSSTEDGLPTCQIARIARHVQALVPASGGAFWMDSLCIPGSTALRTRAIRRRAQAYTDAALVLVLDAVIRAQCAASRQPHENVFWLAVSGWVRRVWTLQEGILARELHCEFSDGLVNVADLERALRATRLQVPYREYLPLLHYRSTRQRPEGTSQCEIGDVVKLLQRRSTAKSEDETLAVAGLLPIDVNELLQVPGPSPADVAAQRMRSFYLQLKTLPRQLLTNGARKLEIPNFRWAPKRLTENMDAWTYFGTATCTADGLRGVYAGGAAGRARLSRTRVPRRHPQSG